MSSLEEPLISRSSPSEGEETATADYDGAAPEDDAAAIPPPSSPPPSTFFIYLLTLSAGLSGLLFGCKPVRPLRPPLTQKQGLTQERNQTTRA